MMEKRVCLWNFYINMVSQKYQMGSYYAEKRELEIHDIWLA